MGASRSRSAQIQSGASWSLFPRNIKRVVRVHFERVLPQTGTIRLAHVLYRVCRVACSSQVLSGAVHRAIPLVRQGNVGMFLDCLPVAHVNRLHKRPERCRN